MQLSYACDVMQATYTRGVCLVCCFDALAGGQVGEESHDAVLFSRDSLFLLLGLFPVWLDEFSPGEDWADPLHADTASEPCENTHG